MAAYYTVSMITYAYIDASNLFYGGKKSLGWSVDFEKLYKYLQDRFDVSRIYYFGGLEIYEFPFDYLINDTVPLKELEKYLKYIISEKSKILSSESLASLNQSLKQTHFYMKLEYFGYIMILKPVKMYKDEYGFERRKANCDVDMTFSIMKDIDQFDRIIVLSGDGDFLPVLKYSRDVIRKEVLVLSRGPRTAREIKRFAGEKFMDLTNNNLKSMIEVVDL